MVLLCIVTASLYLYRFKALFLKALHAAQLGVSIMERRARAIIFWSGMTKDINNVCNSCINCHRNVASTGSYLTDAHQLSRNAL